MMDQPRFAIVGCGKIAHRHAECIVGLGILEAVCDIDGGKAANFAHLYHAKAYRDLDELLGQIPSLDIICICTPNGLHAVQSIAALQAGFNVLCEKPMALTVQDCAAMISAARQADRKLVIVKQNRFNPPVIAVKNAIDDNRLGKIFNVQLNCFWNRNKEYYQDSWKGSKKLDGGPLFTQFSHFIDALYWMAGGFEYVQGYGSNFGHQGIVEYEDTGSIIVKFLSGAIGTINYTVNSFEKNLEGSITIFGERGVVKIGGQYLNELEYQNIKEYKIKDLLPGNPANHYGHYSGSMSNHHKVYENLIQILKSDGAIASNELEASRTVEMIELIYRNLKVI
jgi:UDP-N-acetyl-2-amino-2-deoxyglucuronate dehydrogenase